MSLPSAVPIDTTPILPPAATKLSSSAASSPTKQVWLASALKERQLFWHKDDAVAWIGSELAYHLANTNDVLRSVDNADRWMPGGYFKQCDGYVTIKQSYHRDLPLLSAMFNCFLGYKAVYDLELLDAPL